MADYPDPYQLAEPEPAQVDYRENPSAGQTPTQETSGLGHDKPNPSGFAVPPFTDAGIESYDLSDKDGDSISDEETYRELGAGSPVAPATLGAPGVMDAQLAWERATTGAPMPYPEAPGYLAVPDVTPRGS